MWKSLLRIGTVVLVAAAGLWVLTFGSFKQEVRMSVDGGLPMPAFRLPVLDAGLFEGDTTFVDSRDLRGKVVILAWWATWCGPCIAEQPSLLALQEEFEDRGLVVLGVLHKDRPGEALAWLRENNRQEFRTIVGSSELARAARVGGLPNTALVDRNGVISEYFLGYWSDRDQYVHDAVQELVRREGPSTTEDSR